MEPKHENEQTWRNKLLKSNSLRTRMVLCPNCQTIQRKNRGGEFCKVCTYPKERMG